MSKLTKIQEDYEAAKELIGQESTYFYSNPNIVKVFLGNGKTPCSLNEERGAKESEHGIVVMLGAKNLSWTYKQELKARKEHEKEKAAQLERDKEKLNSSFVISVAYSEGNGFYVSKDRKNGNGFEARYLHKDGVWQGYCGAENFYKTFEEAEAALNAL